MNLSKPKQWLKTGLKYATLTYCAAYLAAGAHIWYDHSTYNSKRLADGGAAFHLNVKEYTTSVSGVKKRFTLVGEKHIYSKEENAIAHELVAKHDFYANESGKRGASQDESFVDSFFLTTSSALYVPFLLFYSLGSGRHYPSISSIVSAENKEIVALEADGGPLVKMDVSDKASILFVTAGSFVVAPAGYYLGKEDSRTNIDDIEETDFKVAYVDERDKVMAQSIVELLNADGVDNLLVNVGAGHVPGIERLLDEEFDLHKTSQIATQK